MCATVSDPSTVRTRCCATRLYCYDTHDLQSDSDVEASDSGCEEDDTPPSCGAMQVEHASVVAEE